MRCPLHLILKHLISSVVSLAQLVSPSVALLAKLVLVNPFFVVVFSEPLPPVKKLTSYLNVPEVRKYDSVQGLFSSD